MGQDESRPIDDSIAPETLDSRTVDAVAKYIKDGRVKRIVTMVRTLLIHFHIKILTIPQVGAGISTSAGIPDFRSPDTGLYANLARLNLPYAEAVFDISYFRNNPYPFYTLAHELYPGRYRPTITHSFIALLERKGLLHMHFSQNIDCLDREAGVSGSKIVEAHGSFASQRCIECGRTYPDADMREMVRTKEVPHCGDEACLGLVKPDIVFFGEQLPAAFFQNRSKPAEADLVIVMGTSLTVQPFAALPQLVMEGTPRVLINLEAVGTMGSRADDVLILGDCDAGVRKLADACGWLEELEEMWAKTAPASAVDRLGKKDEKELSKDEKLEAEIDKLTKDVDETLKLGREHATSAGQTGVTDSKPVEKQSVMEKVEGGDASEVTKPSAPVTESISETVEAKTNNEKTADTEKPEPAGGGKEEGGGLDHVFVGGKKSAL